MPDAEAETAQMPRKAHGLALEAVEERKTCE